MFRRILVPVDLTPKALRAARVAARFSGKAVTLTLLHVIEKIGDGTPGLDRFYRRLDSAARRKLEPLANQLGRRGVKVRVVIVYGNRLREILRYASESRCDLVVMASHRLERNRPGGGWETLSYEVGLLSTRPVLLVK